MPVLFPIILIAWVTLSLFTQADAGAREHDIGLGGKAGAGDMDLCDAVKRQ